MEAVRAIEGAVRPLLPEPPLQDAQTPVDGVCVPGGDPRRDQIAAVAQLLDDQFPCRVLSQAAFCGPYAPLGASSRFMRATLR